VSTGIGVLVFFALGAVAIALTLGLGNMTKGGNANTSQMLMRWRVILQFIAVVVLMAIVFIKSGAPG
jgi:hypothetical protein